MDVIDMDIHVKYKNGVFKPLEKIEGFEEGEELEVHIERTDWKHLAMKNPSFDFLKDEPDIYTEEDVLQ